MQMTFRLGLSYLPLAITGLSALEAWASQLQHSILHPHFKHILPYLDGYLKTPGTAGQKVIMYKVDNSLHFRFLYRNIKCRLNSYVCKNKIYYVVTC